MLINRKSPEFTRERYRGKPTMNVCIKYNRIRFSSDVAKEVSKRKYTYAHFYKSDDGNRWWYVIFNNNSEGFRVANDEGKKRGASNVNRAASVWIKEGPIARYLIKEFKHRFLNITVDLSIIGDTVEAKLVFPPPLEFGLHDNLVYLIHHEKPSKTKFPLKAEI